MNKNIKILWTSNLIIRDDTKEDVFVHYKSIKPMLINLTRAKKKLNLMDKEKVQFDVVKSNQLYGKYKH